MGNYMTEGMGGKRKHVHLTDKGRTPAEHGGAVEGDGERYFGFLAEDGAGAVSGIHGEIFGGAEN